MSWSREVIVFMTILSHQEAEMVVDLQATAKPVTKVLDCVSTFANMTTLDNFRVTS